MPCDIVVGFFILCFACDTVKKKSERKIVFCCHAIVLLSGRPLRRIDGKGGWRVYADQNAREGEGTCGGRTREGRTEGRREERGGEGRGSERGEWEKETPVSTAKYRHVEIITDVCRGFFADHMVCRTSSQNQSMRDHLVPSTFKSDA